MSNERTLILTPDETGRLHLTEDGRDTVVSFDSFIEALHYAASVVQDGDTFETTLIFRDPSGKVMMKTLV